MTRRGLLLGVLAAPFLRFLPRKKRRRFVWSRVTPATEFPEQRTITTARLDAALRKAGVLEGLERQFSNPRWKVSYFHLDPATGIQTPVGAPKENS